MKRFSKNQFYIVCLLFIAAFSCKDKEPKPDCGCDGPTAKVLTDVKASYYSKGAFLLRLTSDENVQYESSVLTCSISDTLKITPDIKNPDYIVSGNLKKECSSPGFSSFNAPPRFEVTSTRKGL